MNPRAIRYMCLIGLLVISPGRAFGAEGDQSLAVSVRDGVLTVHPPTQITINGTPATAQQEGLLSSAFDRIEVPSLPSLEARTSLTVAAWVALSASPQGYQTVLFKGDRATEPQRIHFSLCLCDGIPEFKYMDAAGKWQGIMRNADMLLCPGEDSVPLVGLPKLKGKTWHHVAGTFSNGRVAVYLDGKVVAAGFANGQAETTDLAVVRYNPDGTLDTGFASGGLFIVSLGDYGSSG